MPAPSPPPLAVPPPRAVVRPLVVSMGDPAGIGPEIIAKALRQRPEWLDQVVVAGDVATLHCALRRVQEKDAAAMPLPLAELSSLADWSSAPSGCLLVVQACDLAQPVAVGRVSAEAGQAAAQCIRFGAMAALEGQASALVTAPVHKEALAAAGVEFPGHTELLQALAARHLGRTAAELPVRMMLSCPGLRTVLVSIHVSLRDALRGVNADQLDETIRLTHEHFCMTGWPQPRIAVAGLNPHAGEGGLFGTEEIEVIGPAVIRAQAQGLQVSGPHAPDTVFMRTRQGAFDVVIAMYHDQGLIPVKLLGLDHGVNTTIGLPFVRTSPDHGTAMDIAGTGQASPASLIAAIEAALTATVRNDLLAGLDV